jgi:uncharacterized protein (DUF1015 family)
MARIRPFRGVRYNLDRVQGGDVVSPPYDVIDGAYQQALYDRHPNNVVRIIQGKEEAGDGEAVNRYTRAKVDYDVWKSSGIMVQDETPSLYVYEQTFEIESHRGIVKKTRQGIVTLVEIEVLGEGQIYPHEHTMPGPKADRLALMEHTEAAFGQIFSLFSDPEGKVAALVEPQKADTPLFEFDDEEGVAHRFWRLSDESTLSDIQSFFVDRDLFIADGHHRYETAVTYRDNRFAKEGKGDRSYAYSMQTLVNMDDDEGMAIKPIHRVVVDLGPGGATALRDDLGAWFDVEETDYSSTDDILAQLESRVASGATVLAALMGTVDRVTYLTLKTDVDLGTTDRSGRSDAWRRLDSGLLQLVLGEALDLDEAALTKGEKVQFIKVEPEVRRLVEASEACVGFYLSSVSMQQLRDVVLAGERMPPKSTFFYPKVFTGLVVQDFGEF